MVGQFSGCSEYVVGGKEKEIKKAGKVVLDPTMENLEYLAWECGFYFLSYGEPSKNF